MRNRLTKRLLRHHAFLRVVRARTGHTLLDSAELQDLLVHLQLLESPLEGRREMTLERNGRKDAVLDMLLLYPCQAASIIIAFVGGESLPKHNHFKRPTL